MDTNSVQAIQEAFRRRAGQAPSTTAIPGGAQVANSMQSSNPLMAAPNAPAPTSAPSAAGDMTQEGRKQLAQSQPGEATLITKALISRHKVLSDAGV